MAHAEIPEGLRAIRNKYPVARCDAKSWAEIDRLASTGDEKDLAKAEELARKCTFEHPRLRARHDGALTARARRRKFLIVQRTHERTMAGALRAAADRMERLVGRYAQTDGKVSPGRAASLLEALKEPHRDAYKDMNSAFLALIRKAVTLGLKSAMAQAQRVIDRARALGNTAEADALGALAWPAGYGLEEAGNPLRVKTDYAIGSSVFKKLFKGALRQTMAAGLFGKTGVSNRVWDLRDANFLTLKRLVAAGIARGDGAAKISRDIRGLLHQPETLRGAARAAAQPGVGVYRSAFKNAMRLTRTESNRAFAHADALFAAEKKWNVVWLVSTGQRERDDCDALNGKEMTPEEFANQYPVHPMCLCYSSVVVPAIG